MEKETKIIVVQDGKVKELSLIEHGKLIITIQDGKAIRYEKNESHKI